MGIMIMDTDMEMGMLWTSIGYKMLVTRLPMMQVVLTHRLKMGTGTEGGT